MTAHAMASPFRRAATVPSGSAARCPAKGPPEPAGGPASGGPSDATPSSAGGQPGARVTTSPIHDNRHGVRGKTTLLTDTASRSVDDLIYAIKRRRGAFTVQKQRAASARLYHTPSASPRLTLLHLLSDQHCSFG
ncbi:unnamed protein product [Lampetra planeri]